MDKFKSSETKRKSRNLSEKKRRDQFNNLINELNNLIDPHYNHQSDVADDADLYAGTNRTSRGSIFEDAFGGAGAGGQRLQADYLSGLEADNSVADGCFDELGCFKAATSSQQRVAGAKHKTMSSSSSFVGSSASNRQRKMDKSSVLKCAMEFLKRHAAPQQDAGLSACDKELGVEFRQLDTSSWKPGYITDDEFSVQMLEALDAFIVVCEVNNDARIIYSSDTLTNLLNYTGTCNSLRHHDFVSLFDLVAPDDRPQIEKLFQASECAPSVQNENLEGGRESGSATRPSESGRTPTSSGEYVSLSVNCRIGLNLTEIKQRRLRQRTANILQPNGQNLERMKQAAGECGSDHRGMNVAPSEPSAPAGLAKQQAAEQEVYMQMIVQPEPSGGRSQQSIAEQQQHLLSDGRSEEQEHNQQQQRCQAVELMQVDNRAAAAGMSSKPQRRPKQQQQPNQEQHQKSAQTSDENGSSSSSEDVRHQQANSGTSSGANSDENDQPSSTGSDDASDSNQSQAAAKPPERRHYYRHHHHHNHGHGHQHHHHHHHGHHHNQYLAHHARRHHPKQPNGQQYESVRLMATFKGLDDNTVRTEDAVGGRYKFEEPPPPPLGRNRYFICIGRLDVPRFSYDLKIIAPPMRSGTNVFHNNQFLSKHTLKWRFLWVDNRAPSIIGYLPLEVLGTSGYDYYHWDDLDKLVISHEGLMRDGQASSGPYRFLTKGQQWIWLQTKYCIILKAQYYADQKRRRQDKSLEADQRRSNDGQSHPQVPEQQVYGQTQLYNYDCTMNQDYQGVEGAAYAGAQTEQHYDLPPIYDKYQSYYYQQQPFEQQQQQLPSFDQTTNQINYSICQQEARTDAELGAHRDLEPVHSNSGCLKRIRSEEQHQRQQHQEILPASEREKCEGEASGEQQGVSDGKQAREEAPKKSGSSFASRTKDQFKFILCVHTVIGFDESDGYVNSVAPAAGQQQQQQASQSQHQVAEAPGKRAAQEQASGEQRAADYQARDFGARRQQQGRQDYQ